MGVPSLPLGLDEVPTISWLKEIHSHSLFSALHHFNETQNSNEEMVETSKSSKSNKGWKAIRL